MKTVENSLSEFAGFASGLWSVEMVTMNNAYCLQWIHVVTCSPTNVFQSFLLRILRPMKMPTEIYPSSMVKNITTVCILISVKPERMSLSCNWRTGGCACLVFLGEWGSDLKTIDKIGCGLGTLVLRFGKFRLTSRPILTVHDGSSWAWPEFAFYWS